MKKEKNYGLIMVVVILGLFVVACLVSVVNEMYIAGPYEDAADEFMGGRLSFNCVLGLIGLVVATASSYSAIKTFINSKKKKTVYSMRNFDDWQSKLFMVIIFGCMCLGSAVGARDALLDLNSPRQYTTGRVSSLSGGGDNTATIRLVGDKTSYLYYQDKKKIEIGETYTFVYFEQSGILYLLTE